MKIVRAMVLSVLVISLPAIAAPAHQHGSAKIDISVEGNKFTIGLEMPLDSTMALNVQHVLTKKSWRMQA